MKVQIEAFSFLEDIDLNLGNRKTVSWTNNEVP